jgi:hypothetical protein
MEPTIKLNLTKEEYSFILESLLFSCSVDANADWDYDDTMKIKDLLIKMRLNQPDIPTNRINVNSQIQEKYEYHDLHTKELVDYFPEIKLDNSFV